MSWLTKATRSLENPSLSLNDPQAWEDAGLLSRSMSGVRVTPRRALGYPPLWRGINLIANSVKKLRPIAYKGDEIQAVRAKDHPAYPILRRKANPFLKASVWRQTLAYHAVLFGNGYSLIVRDQRLRPLQMIPLSPASTFPIQMNGGVWYITTIGTETRKIPAADVFHVHGLSFDGLKGLSVIEIMADALGLGISARDYAARFFAQGASASGILMIPGHLKPDAITNAMKDFAKIATGVTNQHKVGLLQDGVKWQPMTINAQESQMHETRSFEAKEVANILGLPPHKLGDNSRTSYNSLEIENQAYLDDSLDPWLCTFEDEFETKLLTPEEQATESHFIEFNRNVLLRTDKKARATIYSGARQWGWMTVNEIRREEGLPPIGPEGDIFIQPTNMAAVGDDPEPDPTDPNEPPAPDPAPAPAGKKKKKPAADPNATRSRVLAACWESIQERCKRFDKIETDQVLAAAKRGDAKDWPAKWWPGEEARISAALAPELKIIGIVEGWPDARAAELAAGAAKRHVSKVAAQSADFGAWVPDQLFTHLKESEAGNAN